jgi:molybdopterin-synthase adenylyltransferase
MMPLTDSEIERYARHIVLPEVGGPGQNKLKNASVLVIGAGGLGAPLLMYLAAAGVGRIGIVDHDTVSLSNLQRQIVHTTDHVGLGKTESAVRMLAAINPHVVVEQHRVRITADNAMALISRYDIVADGCDNFPTRFLVSDACYFAQKPLVSAAVGQFDGQISTFKPYAAASDGTPNPTYRCFIGELPERGLFPACEEAGVLGALPGIIGSMQAMEVIKEIIGAGEGLVGRILMYDALSARFFETSLKWSPANQLTGKNRTINGLEAANYDDGPAACAARAAPPIT